MPEFLRQEAALVGDVGPFPRQHFALPPPFCLGAAARHDVLNREVTWENGQAQTSLPVFNTGGAV